MPDFSSFEKMGSPVPLIVQQALKHLKICHLSFQKARSYSKKYNYNLNNLIEWKKKTKLVFGEPRKYTKTGKLRKRSGNEDERIDSILESMEAQSSYYIWERLQRNQCFSEEVEERQNDSLISDIENETSKMHRDAQHLQDSISPCSSKDDSSSSLFSLRSHFHESPAPSRKESLKAFEQTHSSAQGGSDLVIPVISPIPGSKSEAVNTNFKAVVSKSSSNKIFSSKTPAPIESPASFKFINDVPLTFKKDLCDDDEWNKKACRFKEDVELLSLRSIPSVKSILSKTMPDLNRFFLNRWRENMIKELGEEGFKMHQEATIKRGINLHANVMELLSGKPVFDIQIMPDNEGHWASLQSAMKHISGVQSLEESLQHSSMMYRGVLDCVATYKDVLCVIDWKTSKKPKPLLKNTYDDPIQVAAYMGLVNANNMTFGSVTHGLLVIIYPDGSPAHIHMMNQEMCTQYWQDWCHRLHHFYQLVYTEKFKPKAPDAKI